MEEDKKFSKEEWFKLTKEEQDFHTFEFNKAVEKRKRLTIISTRALALLFILALFYLGYVQIKALDKQRGIMDDYGNLGYCYLCGQEAFRSCECVYEQIYTVTQQHNDINLTEKAQELAEHNSKPCLSYKQYQEKILKEGLNLTNSTKEISFMFN